MQYGLVIHYWHVSDSTNYRDIVVLRTEDSANLAHVLLLLAGSGHHFIRRPGYIQFMKPLLQRDHGYNKRIVSDIIVCILVYECPVF